MDEHTSHPPDFIIPPSIRDFDMDAVDKMLDGIRERRLRAVHIYEATRAALKAVQDEKSAETLVKQTALLMSAIDRLEELINKTEARVSKVRVLRLELGID